MRVQRGHGFAERGFRPFERGVHAFGQAGWHIPVVRFREDDIAANQPDMAITQGAVRGDREQAVQIGRKLRDRIVKLDRPDDGRIAHVVRLAPFGQRFGRADMRIERGLEILQRKLMRRGAGRQGQACGNQTFIAFAERNHGGWLPESGRGGKAPFAPETALPFPLQCAHASLCCRMATKRICLGRKGLRGFDPAGSVA